MSVSDHSFEVSESEDGGVPPSETGEPERAELGRDWDMVMFVGGRGTQWLGRSGTSNMKHVNRSIGDTSRIHTKHCNGVTHTFTCNLHMLELPYYLEGTQVHIASQGRSARILATDLPSACI